MRADLERDQVVRIYADQEGHDGEEHHECPMHRDQRVVKLRQDDPAGGHRLGQQVASRDRLPGIPELVAQHDGQESADEQKEKAGK
jgi:hypothetical protein